MHIKLAKPIEAVKREKIGRLYNYKKQILGHGLEIDGMVYPLDDRSLGRYPMISSSFDASKLSDIDFAAANGWIRLDRDQFLSIWSMVASYVQAVYTICRFHEENIGQMTSVKEVVEYDFTTGWPSNQISGKDDQLKLPI